MNLFSNLINPPALKREILEASNQEFWLYSVLFAVVAAAGFYFAFEFFRRARVIEDTPTSRIRSAAQGYVELVGYGDTIEGPEIVAPLSKTPCTWYRYKVEKLGDKHDQVVDSGVSEELFVLVGQTGRCVIDPDGAIVTPTVKRCWYGASYENDSGSVMGGMGRRYRFTEERMHPGDSLYAIGFFRSVGGVHETFNTAQEVRELLAKWKKDQQKMLAMFDKNKDGVIDAHEWENIRKVANYFVRKRQAKRKVPPVTHILSKPENTKQPYMLSTKPADQLIKKYKIYSLASFLGFLMIGSFTAWMFLVRV